MSKAVLISIKPEWCSLIAIGKKTVEVRKTKPKLDTPFKCYIYCTKTPKGWFFMNAPDVRRDGKVIGEFICNQIYTYSTCECADGMSFTDMDITEMSCMTKSQLEAYEMSAEFKENTVYKVGLFAWHISELKIYDKPKELSEFGRYGKVICPQILCGRGKCGHWRYMRVNADEYDYDCDCNGLLDDFISLSRPPQSWSYVEEREENA